MSQLKCDGCRLRLQQDRVGSETALSCPSCGEPLEPAARLDEIVGYRAIRHPLGADLADPTALRAQAVVMKRPPDRFS